MVFVKVYVTDDERDQLADDAQRAGVSVSAYVRARLFKERGAAPDLLGRIEDHERRLRELEGGGVEGPSRPRAEQPAKVTDPAPDPLPSEPALEPKPPPKIASRELPNWKRATDLSR